MHTRVVVIDDLIQRREAPVVVEPSLEMGEQLADRRGAVAMVRGPVSLEAVDADLGGRVQVPPGIRPQRFDMAAVALALPLNSSSPRAAAAGSKLPGGGCGAGIAS